MPPSRPESRPPPAAAAAAAIWPSGGAPFASERTATFGGRRAGAHVRRHPGGVGRVSAGRTAVVGVGGGRNLVALAALSSVVFALAKGDKTAGPTHDIKEVRSRTERPDQGRLERRLTQAFGAVPVSGQCPRCPGQRDPLCAWCVELSDGPCSGGNTGGRLR